MSVVPSIIVLVIMALLVFPANSSPDPRPAPSRVTHGNPSRGLVSQLDGLPMTHASLNQGHTSVPSA
jgi:hypothetical protein